MNLTSMGKSLNFIIIQVQALEGLGQENSRLAASNEAIVKQLSGATSSVRLSHLFACLPHYACRIHRETQGNILSSMSRAIWWVEPRPG